MLPGNKPILLDLFCGAGGAAMGYKRAGFYVIGVDHKWMPTYAGDRFILADATTYPLAGYDMIHASPPCQHYSVTKNIHQHIMHPDLLPQMRCRLHDQGAPFVIENVPGAPMGMFVMLCGSMFGLGVRRHRWFECFPQHWHSPLSCRHHKKPTLVAGHFKDLSRASQSMGIDWMDRRELAQAIPPAYTEYIGRLMMQHVQGDT